MKTPKASIIAKLRKHSREKNKVHQQTLIRYFQERLLYRLSLSGYCERLFLYMASKAKLPVMDHLDVSKVDIGSGDRVIVKNGVYNSEFRISIPKELAAYV